jgi:type IV pilus assembly protein PilE
MQTNTHRYRSRGMTLIELMIVVSIVAILGSIAVANYRGYVLRSNRTEATAALLRIQVAQEKYYLNKNAYAGNLVALGLGTRTTTERGYYTLTVLPGPNDTYLATANATGSQTADTACQTFTINQSGDKTPTPSATNKCWR